MFYIIQISGSATTAHAVMQLNAEDGGKRKFIMVRLNTHRISIHIMAQSKTNNIIAGMKKAFENFGLRAH